MAPSLERYDGSGCGAVTFLDHERTRGSGGGAETMQLGEYRGVAYLKIEALRASRDLSQTRAER